MNKLDTYNARRADKVSVLIIYSVIILMILQSLIVGGVSEFLDMASKSSVVLVLVAIIYFLPINKYLRGLLFGLIPGIVSLVLFLMHFILLISTISFLQQQPLSPCTSKRSF